MFTYPNILFFFLSKDIYRLLNSKKEKNRNNLNNPNTKILLKNVINVGMHVFKQFLKIYKNSLFMILLFLK